MPHVPRPPALSHGFVSFLWGLGLGVYIWIGLLAIGASWGTSIAFGAVGGALVFFLVRVFGSDSLDRGR